ncbi:oligosaccharide flippase family protein [Halobaculum litoreum]|uniref:Oligosaccharide flippase family protein n=1 Tax=Halobaculum litoreum TaxID=3031998 RepID=A0ABD5XWJ9_9EURY
MAASLRKRIASGVKATFAANTFDMLANAALIVLLTRYLMTPAEYGTLNFVLAAASVVAILGTLGLPKSAGRYVTEYVEADPGLVRYVVRRSLTFVVGLALVVGAALVVVGGPLARLIGQDTLVPFLLIGAGYVIGNALLGYSREMLRAFDRVEWSGIVRVTMGVARVVFVVALVALGYGVAGALWGYVAGYFVAALVGGLLLAKRLAGEFEAAADPDTSVSRRILEYSVPLTATRGRTSSTRRWTSSSSARC